MRKRPISHQKMNESDPSSEESTTQVCTSAFLSLWHSFLSLDQRFTTHMALCATKESPLGHLRPFMKMLEISCHGVPWIFGTLLLFFCSHKPHDVMVSVNLFFALLFDLVVVGLLKAIFRRSRPSFNVTDMFLAPSVDKFSFPSGHATRAAFMGLFVSFHIFTTYLYILITILWSVNVSISRILLGRHHIFDVICGFLIGIMSYYVYLQLWISEETCMHYLDSYFGHMHL